MHRLFLVSLFLGIVACATESSTLVEEEGVGATEAAIDVAEPAEGTTEAAIDDAKKTDKVYGEEHNCGECAGCSEEMMHAHHGS